MKKRTLLPFLLLSPMSLFAEEASKLNLAKVFQGSPVIYSVLILLSILSFIICFYSLFTLKVSGMMPSNFVHQIREHLLEKRFDAALMTCQQDSNFSSNVIACGIASRRHGPQVMVEAMQAEGKRRGNPLWKRISILNKIAILAPMLGLLGSVVSMFYAFYDVSRSQENITSIFDGLGVAMGTTVCGLVVAILAMVFHTTLKYRVVRLLKSIENEALSLGTLIEPDLSFVAS